jgi:phosphatidylinositol glycan class T
MNDGELIDESMNDFLEHKLYHIILPRLSSTCTESLTPFLALLPCSSHAGLSSLLNPHRLFDGDYTLLGAHYSIVEGGIGEVRLVVGSVSDPIRRDRLKGGLGRRGSFLRLF